MWQRRWLPSRVHAPGGRCLQAYAAYAPELLQAIASHGMSQYMPASGLLHEQDTLGDCTYVLLSGSVQLRGMDVAAGLDVPADRSGAGASGKVGGVVARPSTMCRCCAMPAPRAAERHAWQGTEGCVVVRPDMSALSAAPALNSIGQCGQRCFHGLAAWAIAP